MNARNKLLLITGLLLAGIGPALATNHVVSVGGATLTFTPKFLTINAGDSVTFKNAGGFHNVHSDPGTVTSFKCSVNCASNNGPDSSAWSSTVTFPKAGTVGYYCEVHGAPGQGMFGSITVNAVSTTPAVTVGGYMSGTWYTPGQGGHGFLLDAEPNNAMVAFWFAYMPDGSGPDWIYAQGNYDPTSNTVTLPAAIYTGSAFPPNFDTTKVVQTLWGNLTFTFTDCDHGTVSWDSTVPGYGSGSLPLLRLTRVDGASCPQ